MSSETITRAYPEPIEIDLNDVEKLDVALAKVAGRMLDDHNPDIQKVGLWFKNELVGFIAALADFRRQGYSKGDTINAITNTFAHFLAFATVGLGVTPEQMPIVASKVMAQVAKSYFGMCAKAAGATVECEDIEAESIIAMQKGATVH